MVSDPACDHAPSFWSRRSISASWHSVSTIWTLRLPLRSAQGFGFPFPLALLGVGDFAGQACGLLPPERPPSFDSAQDRRFPRPATLRGSELALSPAKGQAFERVPACAPSSSGARSARPL